MSTQTISLPMSASFYASTTLPLSATFFIIKNFPMAADFYISTSLPMSAVFYSTSTLTLSALFTNPNYLSMSANFLGSTHGSLGMSANFVYTNSLPMSANFSVSNIANFRMRAFLGSFFKNLNLSATFLGLGKTDFDSTVTIVNDTVAKNIPQAVTKDFATTVVISGPELFNFQMFAFFGGAFPNDFASSVVINNTLFGIPNIPVTIVNSNKSDSLSEAKDLVYGLTDSTGYFHIGNLTPGTYQVEPMSSTLTFNPDIVNVTITDSNIIIYFHSDGSFTLQTVAAEPLPNTTGSACFVIPNVDIPGTYSIDGYILPAEYNKYTSMLVTASSISDIVAFMQTFPRNIGEGN